MIRCHIHIWMQKTHTHLLLHVTWTGMPKRLKTVEIKINLNDIVLTHT